MNSISADTDTHQLLKGLRIVAIKGDKCEGCGLCELTRGAPVAYRAAALYSQDGAELVIPMCGTEPTLEAVAEHLRFYAACGTDADAVLEAFQDSGPAWFRVAPAVARLARRVRWFFSPRSKRRSGLAKKAAAFAFARQTFPRRYRDRVELMTLLLSLDFLPWLAATQFHHSSLAAHMLLDLTLGWTVLGWLGALALGCTRMRHEQKSMNLPKTGYVDRTHRPGDSLRVGLR
jgi:hypothetical protein